MSHRHVIMKSQSGEDLYLNSKWNQSFTKQPHSAEEDLNPVT